MVRQVYDPYITPGRKYLRRTTAGLRLLLRVILRPLSLGLADQALLVLPFLLCGVCLCLRLQALVVIEAVEDADAEGGPPEDLYAIASVCNLAR